MKETVIDRTIREHIREQQTVFVFPTQTAASLWADRATLTAGVRAVPLERFIAWDEFKSSSIRGTQQTRTSIPSVLRTVFASNLIMQNAQSPFFRSIIVPEHAGTASGFTDWISGLLPSLALWKKRFEETGIQPDDEDKDFLLLYERYSQFLDQNGLFDPAWETPPFRDDGNLYIVFFPEILMDWLEYRELLESSSSIQLVHLPPEAEERPVVHLYDNSRTELRQLAIYIRRMHDSEHVAWTDIAIDVPDLDTYAPYLERELSLFEIPAVRRNGTVLSKTQAGSLFDSVRSCVNEDFSYDSVRRLLLNNALPWREPELIQELLGFGRENNCICSYEKDGKKHDAWLDAFSSPAGTAADMRVQNFYKSLKRMTAALVGARTFADIRLRYFEFRDRFLDMEQCTEKSDGIMGRCISELSSLINLEKSFPQCELPSAYSFFADYLSQKMYVAQSDRSGVQILPYRLGACAPFSCHAIIDASQSSLSLVFKRLGFLRDDKRQRLGIAEDPDVSALYMRLYGMNSGKECRFSVAQHTFSSYALEHSYLTPAKEPGSESDDLYAKERALLLQQSSGTMERAAVTQRRSADAWLSAQPDGTEEKNVRKLTEAVRRRTARRSPDERLSISYSALREFSACPRMHFMKRVLGLKPEDNEASLMNKFGIGDFYHLVMKQFCDALKEENLSFSFDARQKELLSRSVEKAIARARESAVAREVLTIEREALEDVVSGAVQSLSKKIPECSVVEAESSYTCEVPGKDYLLTGKIDCLLKTREDGEYILIDFKTSDSGIPKADELYGGDDSQTTDFQMPMYRYLLSHSEPEKNVRNCLFFGIKDGKLRPVTGDAVQAPPGSTLDKAEEEMLSCADSYAEAFLAADFSISASPPAWETCRGCDYAAVCRRTFTVSHKED